MWESESFCADDPVAIQEYVQINDARRVCERFNAAHGSLYSLAALEQFQWRQRGFNFQRYIQIPGLILETHRLSFVKGRNLQSAQVSVLEGGNRLLDICLPVTQIRSEGEIGFLEVELHPGVPRL